MKDIKRIWDTTEKKMVWGTNTSGKKSQVWKVGEGFYVDNKGKREETAGTPEVYGPTWKDMPEGDSMGYYDTNKPTVLYEPETPTETPTEPESEFTLQNQWFYDATSGEIRFFAASGSDTDYIACSLGTDISIDVSAEGELDDSKLAIDASAYTGNEGDQENAFIIWLSPSHIGEVADYIADTLNSLSAGAEDAIGTFNSNVFSAMETLYATPNASNIDACNEVAMEEEGRIIEAGE